MPVAPSPLASRRIAWLARCCLLALSGCGGADSDKFAPQCPQPSIPTDFNDLRRYRGAGRDIVDSVIEGRITGIGGSCTRDGPATVVTTLSVGIELARGPASNSRNANVGYFVAVSDGDRILDKQVFRLRAEFPPNTDRLRLTGDEVQLRLPVSATKNAASYRISVGFDLTQPELAINRARASTR